MNANDAYLRSVELDRTLVADLGRYPFNLSAVRHLDRLPFHPKVTYVIGENGMGKSTLLEAIAVAWGFNPEGGSKHFAFATRSTHSALHQHLRLTRGVRRARDGFFFRAESYYNVASYIDELDSQAAPAPPIRNSYGGKSLHEMSHGESFFAAFMHRFGGNSLYILDEPEAALSPLRQMSLLSRIHELVGQKSQFIISTHSPILMAYPDALLYQLTPDGIETSRWEETDHYLIMKQFLNKRESMLRELFDDRSGN